MTRTPTTVEPAPVFVDQTGQRGRRLRGFGWLMGILCTGCVVAMISGLIGTQSQAPALTTPSTADTKPPNQYLNAPLPAAPGVTHPEKATAAPAGTPDATAPVTPSDATTSATTTTAAVPAASSPVTAAAQ
ncbi:hypothetical protein ACN6LM_004510 [Streptomyces sp. SAS_281]|uniref:hypothetical protein n=1 Tax=Streptomyces sp. SAS_281 TaxID=3412744 RepID=UPI00403CD5F6